MIAKAAEGATVRRSIIFRQGGRRTNGSTSGSDTPEWLVGRSVQGTYSNFYLDHVVSAFASRHGTYSEKIETLLQGARIRDISFKSQCHDALRTKNSKIRLQVPCIHAVLMRDFVSCGWHGVGWELRAMAEAVSVWSRCMATVSHMSFRCGRVESCLQRFRI